MTYSSLKEHSSSYIRGWAEEARSGKQTASRLVARGSDVLLRRPWRAQITLVENGKSFTSESTFNISQPVAAFFRNVARTRFRDSTRRAQKSHFGCRRLGILSRSLVNRTHSKEEETTSGISGILLEHAQREISCPSMSTLAHQTGALGAFTSEPPSSTVSSRTGSSSTSSNLKATHLPDNGSCESPRPLSCI